MPNVFGDETDHDRMERAGYLWKDGRYVDDPDHRHDWERNKSEEARWAEFDRNTRESERKYREHKDREKKEK